MLVRIWFGGMELRVGSLIEEAEGFKCRRRDACLVVEPEKSGVYDGDSYSLFAYLNISTSNYMIARTTNYSHTTTIQICWHTSDVS